MPTNEQRREAAKRKLDRQLARRAKRTKRRRVYAVLGSLATLALVVGGFFAIDRFLPAADTEVAEPAPAPVPLPTEEPIAIPAETVPPPVRGEPLPSSVECQYPATPQPAATPVEPPPPGPISTEGSLTATMQTTSGPIELTLDRSLAPCTVNSFVSLARQGFYHDSSCHRLVTSPGLQVLQCGDPSGTGTGGPGYTIPDETFPELSYGRGLVAMANTGQPNSGGSQFFLIYGDAQLPPSYTVFATISSEGLDVLDEIAQAGDDGALEPAPGGGAPNQPVTITSVEVVG